MSDVVKKMGDTLKKRKSFSFFTKRQTSLSAITIPDEVTLANLGHQNPRTPPPVVMRAKSSQFFGQPMQKRGSLGAIEDLVQCPLCLEKLNDPKMLACQHTFCLQCLKTQVIGVSVVCPSCKTTYQVTSEDFMECLPSNLYIDSLLKLLISPSADLSTGPERAVSFALTSAPPMAQAPCERCCQCQSVIKFAKEHNCKHCKQLFCGVCWSAHIAELKSQIGSLVRQLESGSERLEHKLNDYKDRYEWLVNQINTNTEKKIADILLEKENLLMQALEFLQKSETSAIVLQKQLKETRENINETVTQNYDNLTNDSEKVSTFMNYHSKTVDALKEVSRWGENKLSFDQERFCIDEGPELPAYAEADEPVTVGVRGIQNPLESLENLALYYRSRHFSPRLVWKKCQRPAGVGVSPWSGQEHIYICGTDSHHIVVIDKQKGKILQRLADAHMLCPHSIAFSKNRKEIYVTDKWKHCVHVLSREGEYKRSIGMKGTKEGCFRSPEGIAVDLNDELLYVCDTGNDRVQAMNITTGAFAGFIGMVNRPNENSSTNMKFTQLNAPTGIAVTEDKVIIVDSGNRRIKIYSFDGEKIHEFGSGGSHKGQFRHPEAVAVDPLGLILVGDSGNARVQIFKPNGHLIRVFGGLGQENGKFGWISGLHITPQLEIIVSDPKNRQVSIF